ncbi:MAG: IucA/IucC family protein [Pseudonocardiaceae bacterium]
MTLACRDEQPSDLVMRDLVDTLIQENLWSFADRGQLSPPVGLSGETVQPGEQWCRIDLPDGWVCFRACLAGALQAFRLSRTPVWHGTSWDAQPRRLEPDELLELLAASRPGTVSNLPHAPQVGADLRTAVQHTAVVLAGRARLTAPWLGGLITGERLAATRNRPFHPTARAAIGWTSDELTCYGPMRQQPLGLDWVAVRRDRLRHGCATGSDRLHEMLLNEADCQQLTDAVHRAGLSLDGVQPLPVHPWQFEHVLPTTYAAELAGAEVVPLARGLGGFYPTASLRTMATAPETEMHVKLPLGVATLGAARLLPPRYLDNGQRAQRTMQQLIDRCEVLRRRVQLCDERIWCGWRHPSGADEFDDRPGQLSAQLRSYPAGLFDDPAWLVLPMAALAAHEWDVLGPVIGPASGTASFDAANFDATDAVEFFGRLAEAFCELGMGFLRYGVLPELHGQNVVVVLRDGVVDRFVLRDHDTLRLYPDWMAAESVADPGYRITSGATQSLLLPSAEALVGYLQTLGFQVNLYGIADALCRHYGIDERVLWAQLRGAVVGTLGRVALPSRVADVIERELLHAQTWPSRLVLGPLLRQGRSAGVSMPTGTGRVPNPLAPVVAARCSWSRVIARRAARQRLLNAFLRETGVPVSVDGTLLRVPLPGSRGVLLAGVEHWSVLGHHIYGDEFRFQPDGGEAVALGHHELVSVLLTELAVVVPAADDAQARQRRQKELAAQIGNSVLHTTRYLQCHGRPPPAVSDPLALTRHAEQSLRFGHPFHPTPKSAEGFSAGDLAAYAPELGTSFVLHYFAVAPELLLEDRWCAAAWVPPEVHQQAQGLLGSDLGNRTLLPVHPWQAGHLMRQDAVATLVDSGGLVALGRLGRPVYPTSSVRTVCDPTFTSSWKLPLHVRITNFVRNNPLEHARRALDAGRLIGTLRNGWAHEGFEVLLETGYRTIDIDDAALAADVTVLYRENPFATCRQAPQVVAGLLEEGAEGEEPELIRYVWQAADRPQVYPAADHVAEWLRRYLQISLLPLLAVFTADGVSLEAHVQNSLLHLEDGWPARFFVRDMEGASVSRQRWATARPCCAGSPALRADSPVLYDDAEAWSRWKYYVVTNHLGHLMHVLARHTHIDELLLWRVVRDAVRTAQPSRYTRDLLESPVLPAKANLISRLTGRGERPLYVTVPNPLHEVIR